MRYSPPLEKEPPQLEPMTRLNFLACVVTLLVGIATIPDVLKLLLFGWKPFKYFDNMIAYLYLFLIHRCFSNSLNKKRVAEYQKVAKYQKFVSTLGLAWLSDCLYALLGIKKFWRNIPFSKDALAYLESENVGRVDRVYFKNEMIDYLYSRDYSKIKVRRLEYKDNESEEAYEDVPHLSWRYSICLLAVSGYYWYWVLRKTLRWIW